MIQTTAQAIQLFNSKIVNNPVLFKEYMTRLIAAIGDIDGLKPVEIQKIREIHSFAVISNLETEGKLK